MTEHVFAMLEDVDALAVSQVTGPGVSITDDIVAFNGTSGHVIKDTGVKFSIDGTLVGNSDLLVPTEKAVKTYADTKIASTETGTSGHKIPYLDNINIWSGAQTITLSATAATPLELISTNADAVQGPYLNLFRDSASPNAGDNIGTIRWRGRTSAALNLAYNQIIVTLTSPTSGAEYSVYNFYDYVNGVQTLEMVVGNGILVGSAAGGAKGPSTLNATTLYEAGVTLATKYQAADTDLLAIAALATVGLAKRTGAGAWSIVDAVGGIAIQVFTANGTYTPNAAMISCIMGTVGGGAGGGGAASGTNGAGGGGGGGSTSLAAKTAAQVGASQTVTIGATAAGGVAGNNNGTAGNDTSIGALCIGKGGAAGLGSTAPGNGTGGAGGVLGTGDIRIVGQDGSAGQYSSITTVVPFSGFGGSSGMAFGSGAPGRMNQGTGINGGNYGGGGSGGESYSGGAAAAGGIGAGGYAFVIEFLKV